MGFNTVAFILNDMMDSIEKNPKTVAFLLSHPPIHEDKNHQYKLARSLAEEYGEPGLHPQALEIMPTFHADFISFFMAGHNIIDRLERIRTRKNSKGEWIIELKAPDWYVKMLEERRKS